MSRSNNSMITMDSLVKDVKEMKLKVEELVSLVDRCMEQAPRVQHNACAYGNSHENENGTDVYRSVSHDTPIYGYVDCGPFVSSSSNGQSLLSSFAHYGYHASYQDGQSYLLPNEIEHQPSGYVYDRFVHENHLCSPLCQVNGYYGSFENRHDAYVDSYAYDHQHDTYEQQQGYFGGSYLHDGHASSLEPHPNDLGQHTHTYTYEDVYAYGQQDVYAYGQQDAYAYGQHCNVKSSCNECFQEQSHKDEYHFQPHLVDHGQHEPHNHGQHEPHNAGNHGQHEPYNAGNHHGQPMVTNARLCTMQTEGDYSIEENEESNDEDNTQEEKEENNVEEDQAEEEQQDDREQEFQHEDIQEDEDQSEEECVIDNDEHEDAEICDDGVQRELFAEMEENAYSYDDEILQPIVDHAPFDPHVYDHDVGNVYDHDGDNVYDHGADMSYDSDASFPYDPGIYDVSHEFLGGFPFDPGGMDDTHDSWTGAYDCDYYFEGFPFDPEGT